MVTVGGVGIISISTDLRRFTSCTLGNLSGCSTCRYCVVDPLVDVPTVVPSFDDIVAAPVVAV